MRGKYIEALCKTVQATQCVVTIFPNATFSAVVREWLPVASLMLLLAASAGADPKFTTPDLKGIWAAIRKSTRT